MTALATGVETAFGVAIGVVALAGLPAGVRSSAVGLAVSSVKANALCVGVRTRVWMGCGYEEIGCGCDGVTR